MKSLRIKRYYPNGGIRNGLTDCLESVSQINEKIHFTLRKSDSDSIPIILEDKIQGKILANSRGIIEDIVLHESIASILNIALDLAIESLRDYIGYELYLI